MEQVCGDGIYFFISQELSLHSSQPGHVGLSPVSDRQNEKPTNAVTTTTIAIAIMVSMSDSNPRKCAHLIDDECYYVRQHR